MKLIAMTVCVGYSEFLSKSIDRWFAGLDDLIVVTSPEDAATQALAKTTVKDDWHFEKGKISRSVTCFVTDAFTRNGAIFNKGLAISEAFKNLALFQIHVGSWFLIFDSDIIPTENWRQHVEHEAPEPGKLYGARRFQEDGGDMPNMELAGYFQMFHSSDPNAQRVPLMEVDWRHAGGFDSEFHQRWKWDQQVWFPMKLTHQGETGKNWFGRDKPELMQAMLDERTRTHRIGEGERMK